MYYLNFNKTNKPWDIKLFISLDFARVNIDFWFEPVDLYKEGLFKLFQWIINILLKRVLLIYTVLLQWSRQRKYIAHAEATANTSTPGSYHRLHHSPTQRLTVSAVRPCLCTSGRTLCVPGLYQWSRALPVFCRPQMSHPLQPCRLQWVTPANFQKYIQNRTEKKDSHIIMMYLL